MDLTEKEIIDFLDKKYPQTKAEKWDFVGYSIKSKNKSIKKLILCLDVNENVINYAIKNKIKLIISFHPFKFGKTWNEIFLYDLFKENQVKKIKENSISIFSIHTNFDQDKYGMKYWFSKKMNLENNIIKLNKFSIEINFNDTLKNLISLLKKSFGLNNVLTNIKNEQTKISKIQIYPGAGDIYDFIKNQKDKNTVLITSDIKWNEQQLLNSQCYNFVMISHKAEVVFNDAMESILKTQFKNLEIIKINTEDFIKGY